MAMKRFLKKGDTFIDIGANIGYLSAVALGFVGKRGEVHSFEPVPEYVERLKEIAAANREYKIIVNQYALGEKEGREKIYVTNLPNIGWNTMIPNFMLEGTLKETVEVGVCRLDSYIMEKRLEDIRLIKIDTEGFEFPVLKGLSGYLENTAYRPVIICEISPTAYPPLDCTPADLSEYMKSYHYRAFKLADPGIEVDITRLTETTDVVFMAADGH